MNVTVFSKDRACQLDAFLRSYYRHVEDTWHGGHSPTVIFACSQPHYYDAYQILKAEYPDVNWVSEGRFKDDVIRSLDPRDPFTVFFVDDIVFRRDFSYDSSPVHRLSEDQELLALSLRLSPKITYCYSLNINTPVPPLDEQLRWNWCGCPGDWGYPMSVDGHIFRTQDIFLLILGLNYRKPNTFESALASHPINRPKLACLPDHAIINVPQNVVQTEWANRAQQGLSAQELNARFLQGQRIDIDPIERVESYSVHWELDYQFI